MLKTRRRSGGAGSASSAACRGSDKPETPAGCSGEAKRSHVAQPSHPVSERPDGSRCFLSFSLLILQDNP